MNFGRQQTASQVSPFNIKKLASKSSEMTSTNMANKEKTIKNISAVDLPREFVENPNGDLQVTQTKTLLGDSYLPVLRRFQTTQRV